MRTRYKTVCCVCGRVFFRPPEQVEICGNCGNETQFKDIWTDTEVDDDE